MIQVDGMRQKVCQKIWWGKKVFHIRPILYGDKLNHFTPFSESPLVQQGLEYSLFLH